MREYVDSKGCSIELGMTVVSNSVPSTIELNEDGEWVISNEYFSEVLRVGTNECEIIDFNRYATSNVPFADETNKKDDWILDYHYLTEISESLEEILSRGSDSAPSIEVIEMILLISSGFEKLLDIKGGCK